MENELTELQNQIQANRRDILKLSRPFEDNIPVDDKE